MSKYLFIFAFILVFSAIGISQKADYSIIKTNGVYLEGYLIRHDFSEGFVSINFEKTVGKKRRTNLRIGIYPDFESSVSIPLTATWMTHPLGNHHFEIGVGAVFRIEHFIDPLGINEREWFYDVPAVMFPIMYRYQKNSGLFFRVGINLFVSWPTLPSPSISVGYKF